MPIALRPLQSSDSIEALTALLHRAYAPLGAMGLNYTAVDQTSETTARRLRGGHCIVAEQGGAIVGTVVVRGERIAEGALDLRESPWYLRRDVAHLHQLGVEPSAQGRGIGNALIAACERWARDHGISSLALDTALPATHLRQRYAALGYADVGDVQWSGKRYRTVIMVKPLCTDPAPTADDAEHRCALVRALWAHVQARDWAAMRAAFAEDAVLHWPVTAERFDGAEAIVRVNAVYPEGWSVAVKRVDALVDGGVQALVEVTQDGVTHFNNARYRLRGAFVHQATEYWAAADRPPAWRNATTLGPNYHHGQQYLPHS
jgi:GNAT superfamily N-acetyltransferase